MTAGPAPPAGQRGRLGRSGEEVVARWYQANGYQVLARNWRCREGEIDVIVGRPGQVVFCEVKTRSSSAFGSPLEAVTPAKQRRLRRLALRWLQENPVGAGPSRSLRFDVASVLGGMVEVIEAAF